MLNIPLPPRFAITATVAYAAAGAGIAGGVILLLWGRHVHRALLAAAGAAAGYLLAVPLAHRLGAPPTTVRIVMVLTLAIVAVVGARAAWVLLGGGLAVGVSTLVLRARVAPPTWPPCETIAAWLRALLATATPEASLLTGHWLDALLMLALPGVAVLILGAVFARMMRIFMTSLLGAAAVIVGMGLALVHRRPALWPGEWGDMVVPALAAAGLALLGLAGQCRGVLAERRREREHGEEAEQDADEQQKGKTRKGRSADKNQRRRDQAAEA